MTATALKQTVPEPAAQAVHDAAARLREREARVELLNRRLDTIEARAAAVRAERGAHQQQVTAALVEGGELPQALPPQPVEPDQAVKIVKAELKRAESALDHATGQHRAALVWHAESPAQ